jgi:hypothetical protein
MLAAPQRRAGRQGPRLVRLDPGGVDSAGAPPGWRRWLLVRRSLRTEELAYYACAGPAGLPLVALVRVAGTRWRVEEAFQAGKGLCGLDQHQVRRWRGWYRWVTLAMLAYAFLVVAAVSEHARHRAPLGLIALTCNELQHLFAALVAAPVADPGHRLRWSWWRRRHQARARACHYRRQANGCIRDALHWVAGAAIGRGLTDVGAQAAWTMAGRFRGRPGLIIQGRSAAPAGYSGRRWSASGRPRRRSVLPPRPASRETMRCPRVWRRRCRG